MFDSSIQHLFEFDKPHFVRDRPPKGTPAGNFAYTIQSSITEKIIYHFSVSHDR